MAGFQFGNGMLRKKAFYVKIHGNPAISFN